MALLQSFRVARWMLLGLALLLPALVAAETKRRFNLAAGDAAEILPRFAEQADREIVFSPAAVRGVRTNSVAGEFLPRDALDLLVARTRLVVTQDAGSGAFAVRVRAPVSNPSSGPYKGAANGAAAREESATATGPKRPDSGGPGGRDSPAKGGATITGQVSNADTSSYLEGALVQVGGTTLVAITDRDGRYELNGVPGESITLLVSFAGLDTQQIPISVGAGRRVVHDVRLTSSVYQMERFTVAGEREGAAKAEMLQRAASNVKNIVASDTFGNIADGNVADFLQRLPGVITPGGNEIREVAIRGAEAALNMVMMDGVPLAGANSTGQNRNFQFEQVSLTNLESIELTKGATPDMEGASIGGTINMTSKSAFDRAGGRIFTYGVGLAHWLGPNIRGTARWKQPFPGYGPSINLSYSDVFGERRNLGIILTASFNETPGPARVSSTMLFQPLTDPGPAYVYDLKTPSVSGTPQTRIGSSLRADYRWSENTTVSFRTSINFYHENVDARTHTLHTSSTLATVDATGNRTGGGLINPNYSNNITRAYAHPTSSYSNITTNTANRSGKTLVFHPSVRHRFEDLSIDYGVSASRWESFIDYGQNVPKFKSRPRGTVDVRLANIGWIVDRSKNGVWPTVTQTEGADLYNLNNYAGLTLGQNEFRGYTTVVGSKIDVRRSFDWKLPTYLKTGVSYRQQSRKIWRDPLTFNYAGPDGILGNADDSGHLAQFLDTSGYYEEANNLKGRSAPWISSYAVARHQHDHPEMWRQNVSANVQAKLQSYKLVDELIAGAYLMGNVQIRKLSVLGGVRVEETRNEGTGAANYLSPEERARRAAWVGAVTDAEALRRVMAQYDNLASNKGQYRDTFPSLHLRYAPFDRVVTRASWSTGVGRPPFGNIIPNETYNDVAQTLSVSNPSLLPQHANSYDLTAEYYLKPQGMIAIGAFKKKIKDYIVSDSSQIVGTGPNNGFDGRFEGYRLTTVTNGGTAEIEGLEFSYQQQFTFLPGWLRGFGFDANYTVLRTEDRRRPNAAVRTGTTLEGFIPKVGNFGLTYRGYDLNVRIETSWRDQYLSNAPSTYSPPRTFWNLKAGYSMSKKLGVFLDVTNIFSEPRSSFYLYKDRVDSYTINSPKLVTGVTGRF